MARETKIGIRKVWIVIGQVVRPSSIILSSVYVCIEIPEARDDGHVTTAFPLSQPPPPPPPVARLQSELPLALVTPCPCKRVQGKKRHA